MELLRNIKILRAKVKRWKDLTDERFAKLNKTTKDTTIPKVSSVGNQSDKSELWDSYLYAKNKLDEAQAEYDYTLSIVMACIDSMDDPLLADLLFYKYIDETPCTWQELADRLYISERYVYTSHSKALEEFQSKIDHVCS